MDAESWLIWLSSLELQDLLVLGIGFALGCVATYAWHRSTIETTKAVREMISDVADLFGEGKRLGRAEAEKEAERLKEEIARMKSRKKDRADFEGLRWCISSTRKDAASTLKKEDAEARRRFTESANTFIKAGRNDPAMLNSLIKAGLEGRPFPESVGRSCTRILMYDLIVCYSQYFGRGGIYLYELRKLEVLAEAIDGPPITKEELAEKLRHAAEEVLGGPLPSLPE